ncbi:MAG: phosphate propanoyltransferase [Propionicimonas sp.]|uniref:phosphate propanoyltransferase n=1 Tax=Propionicimonas sp. TaxID=1955623 RepID=UPI003D09B444
MKDTRQLVEEVTRMVIGELQLRIVVGVSNRHAHLSREDLATLFGLDELTVYRRVRQPSDFAAEQTVSIAGPRGAFPKLRLMGPCRPKTQVELSRTDCIALGIDAPITQSGHLDDAGPIDIEGPRGTIHVEHGVMVAARHIHMGPSHAKAWGLADQDLVQVQFGGERGGVLDNLIIRIKDDWVPEIHLDTDEANALGLRDGEYGKLILP